MGLVLELEESTFSGYIDDGTVYTAKIRDVSLLEKRYKDDDGNPVKKIGFRFQLNSEDDHDGEDLRGETSTRFVNHPDCRLFSWAEAILGMHLPPKYRLNTDDLVDRDCRVMVGKREYEKDGETKYHNFVRDVIPTRQAMASLTAAEQEPF